MSMIRLVQIQIGEYRSNELFDAGALELKRSDRVIFEYDRSTEFGRVVTLDIPRTDLEKNANPRGRVLRKATERDGRQIESNRQKAREAMSVCIARINEQSLDMQIVKAEYSFDSTKLMFYFTAEGRVDFRNLVKDLARVFRLRIELKQIGVRDRAKMVGGYGVCGQNLCCSAFIKDFSQLSIKMAKEQALPLNPSKITGVCGRIKCCMAYEFHVYRELNSGLPKMGAKIQTAEGRGKVINLDILKRMVLVDIGEGKVIKINIPAGTNVRKE